jgi:SAM-dependent methyltransferase
MSKEKIKASVRDRYGRIAAESSSDCGGAPGCCGDPALSVDSNRLGYSLEELKSLPQGSDLNLGCGNPTAIASLNPGEVVVDLGSGGGIDCFLAAKYVGDNGKVIGVDMTAEMLSKARENAEKGGYHNVEFRLGEIEHLPVGDNQADVIISNCVINLSPSKQEVFNEMYRVLKSGGRVAVSDVVALQALPDELKADTDLYVGCIGGALTVDELISIMSQAGFTDINIDLKNESREFIKDWAPGAGVENYVASATIEARKP